MVWFLSLFFTPYLKSWAKSIILSLILCTLRSIIIDEKKNCRRRFLKAKFFSTLLSFSVLRMKEKKKSEWERERGNWLNFSFELPQEDFYTYVCMWNYMLNTFFAYKAIPSCNSFFVFFVCFHIEFVRLNPWMDYHFRPPSLHIVDSISIQRPSLILACLLLRGQRIIINPSRVSCIYMCSGMAAVVTAAERQEKDGCFVLLHSSVQMLSAEWRGSWVGEDQEGSWKYSQTRGSSLLPENQITQFPWCLFPVFFISIIVSLAYKLRFSCY